MIKKVLIVGFGSIGKRHYEIAKEILPSAEFGLFRSGKNNTSSTEVSLNFENLSQALEFKPDITVLANPSPFHIEIGMEFAKIRSHLLIEKPISDRSDTKKEFSEIVKKNNIIVSIGYNLKFSTSLQFLKETLDEGRIGKIYSVQCAVGQYLPDWRAGKDYRQSVSAKKNLGGGVLLELSHEINYLSWLFGKIDSLVCLSEKNSDLEIDVEDSANLLLKIKLSSSNDLIIQLRMDFIRRDPHRSCTIIGENGTLIWDYISGKIEIYDSIESKWKVLFSQVPERNETYIAEWKDFIKAIETHSNPLTTYKEGYETLQVVEAARASNGNLIEVNY